MHSIIHLLTSTAWGGLELYVCTLVVEQQRAGWKPVVVCVAGSKVESFLREHDVEVHNALAGDYINIQALLLTRRLIRKHAAVAVHSHIRLDVWTASLAVRFSNVRWLHSVYMNVAPKRDPLHRFIYRRATAVLAHSEWAAQEIRERYPVDPQRVHVVRYGIDLSPYVRSNDVRSAIRQSLGVNDGEILVGMMGRIDTQKGVREFVDSYTMLPDDIRSKVRYLLIGEPTILRSRPDGTSEYEPDSAACEEYIAAQINERKLADRIIRIGFQREFIPYLNAMDVFALPSYAESYSLSVLNAMAMGLPVIGTRSGGTSEQLGDGTRGLLINPRSPEEIAEAIAKLVTEPELAAQFAKAGEAWVRREHNMDVTLERIFRLYGS